MKHKSEAILELLKLPIREYLCDNLSKKYSDLPNNYNEKIIKLLLNDNKNKSTFDFIFNYLNIRELILQ